MASAAPLAKRAPSRIAGRVSIATSYIGEDIGSATNLDLAGGRTTDFAGDLAVGSDEDDVHKVYLFAGESVSMSMTGAGGTNFGLYIFSPDAVSIWDDDPSYGQNPAPGTTLTDGFKVPESGYYYIDIWTGSDGTYNGGSGAYSLKVTIDRSFTAITLDPQPQLPYLGVATITGKVQSRWGQRAAGDVLLSFSLNGLPYVPMMGKESVDGTFSFTTWPNISNLSYLVQYEGTDAYSPCAQHVAVKVAASLKGLAASRYGTRSYTLSGYLGPQHTAGTSVASIYLWRYVSGRWKAYGYKTAKAANSGDVTKFSVKYKFPYAGKWRMQACHSDADHATTRSSGYVTWTVK